VAALDEEKAFFQQDIVGPFFVFFSLFFTLWQRDKWLGLVFLEMAACRDFRHTNARQWAIGIFSNLIIAEGFSIVSIVICSCGSACFSFGFGFGCWESVSPIIAPDARGKN